jgi:hypothetical protein
MQAQASCSGVGERPLRTRSSSSKAVATHRGSHELHGCCGRAPCACAASCRQRSVCQHKVHEQILTVEHLVNCRQQGRRQARGGRTRQAVGAAVRWSSGQDLKSFGPKKQCSRVQPDSAHRRLRHQPHPSRAPGPPRPPSRRAALSGCPGRLRLSAQRCTGCARWSTCSTVQAVRYGTAAAQR